MKVNMVNCGPVMTESERKAFRFLEDRLNSEKGDSTWYIFTNKSLSLNDGELGKEIDVITIGPPGVRVVEIKNWTAQWIKSSQDLVNDQADIINTKAKKVKGKLSETGEDVGFVSPAFLLTQDQEKLKGQSGKSAQGVEFYSLKDWKNLIGLGGPVKLEDSVIHKLAACLDWQKSQLANSGSLRRLLTYKNLELQTPREDTFHRIYKGIHESKLRKVILHLFDLTTPGDNIEERARREAETLMELSKNSWAPVVEMTPREVPGYNGEMRAYAVRDPEAPSIEKRSGDDSWSTESRLHFALEAIGAIKTIHSGVGGDDKSPLLHRNLNPSNILVGSSNKLVLTGFEYSRLPANQSIGSSIMPPEKYQDFLAPEVKLEGHLSVSTTSSDIFSLCASLKCLFDGREDNQSQSAIDKIDQGLSDNQAKRCTLDHLENEFRELLDPNFSPNEQELPAAKYWAEGEIVKFKDNKYRIEKQLGNGGVGITFKVSQLDPYDNEAPHLGFFVAKVCHEVQMGTAAIEAYNLARAYTKNTLATILEVAKEWKENEFTALMAWIKGENLYEDAGLIDIIASDNNIEPDELALRWIISICEGLELLHISNLVHGDVSPKNIIRDGTEVLLTDYDYVKRIGEKRGVSGTPSYSSPMISDGLVSASDDVYCLAASFFKVLFGVEPFMYEGVLNKELGLNWDEAGDDLKQAYKKLEPFFCKATDNDREKRFNTGTDAKYFLQNLLNTLIDNSNSNGHNQVPEGKDDSQSSNSVPLTLSENQIPWLMDALQSYPASRYGNSETRGLDTKFAEETYVESVLEKKLLDDINKKRVSLVILCGNAGDGKTALLQHIAKKLELGEHQSNKRILEGNLPNGRSVKINLDGAASYQEKSADTLMDELMDPFQNGSPSDDLVHMVAINDGRLLEWINKFEEKNSSQTDLTSYIESKLLDEQDVPEKSYIRFINLNQRSIVGAPNPDKTSIEPFFVEDLLNNLYGGERAREIWAPCESCIAKERCEVFSAAKIFGPESLPFNANSSDDNDKLVRDTARKKLFQAMQFVHLRGEMHITVRELRAAFAYILFGLDFCDEYTRLGTSESVFTSYWDRAFSPDTPGRQGALLDELSRFDPALEANPTKADKTLMNKDFVGNKNTPSYRDLGLDLDSARRKAYFEWTKESVELAGGQYFSGFLQLSLTNDNQDILTKLCQGIANLERLPIKAYEISGVIPLGIRSKTQTETNFWVEKKIENFKIEVVPRYNQVQEGLHFLDREIELVYTYQNGKENNQEERLKVGAELFRTLLELSDGYQVGDPSTDDAFSHLAIFVRRLVREDESRIMALNPSNDQEVYEISSAKENIDGDAKQVIAIKSRDISGGDN